jgi:hypothetical protein
MPATRGGDRQRPNIEHPTYSAAKTTVQPTPHRDPTFAPIGTPPTPSEIVPFSPSTGMPPLRRCNRAPTQAPDRARPQLDLRRRRGVDDAERAAERQRKTDFHLTTLHVGLGASVARCESESRGSVNERPCSAAPKNSQRKGRTVASSPARPRHAISPPGALIASASLRAREHLARSSRGPGTASARVCPRICDVCS